MTMDMDSTGDDVLEQGVVSLDNNTGEKFIPGGDVKRERIL